MSLTIYLIRHGQTEWSLSGQHTGQTDLPLTPEGEIQASRLAPILSKVQFSAVFTSPLKRARRTCELAGLARHSQIDPDLAEWNYGDYEGFTTEEILKESSDWNLFANGTPNGESPIEVSERCDRLIERVSLLSGNIALFSHGHFFSALAARWIGLPILLGEHLELSTSSISTLGFSAHHPETRVISGWNAVL